MGWLFLHAYRMAVQHAPKGGITIAGQQFKGGEFIPSETLERASPKEKIALERRDMAAKRKPTSAKRKRRKRKLTIQQAAKELETVGFTMVGVGQFDLDSGEANYRISDGEKEITMTGSQIEELLNKPKGRPWQSARAVRKFDRSWETNAEKAESLEMGVMNMDPQAMDTIRDYTSGETDYAAINAALREGKMPEEAKRLNDAIDQAGDLPEGLTVYRGIRLSREEAAQMLTDLQDAAKAGETITMSGISSTSLDPDVARGFTGEGRVMFEIRPKTGAYVASLNPFDQAARKQPGLFRGENEVVLQHGKQYRVISVQPGASIGKKASKANQYTMIQLEEI